MKKDAKTPPKMDKKPPKKKEISSIDELRKLAKDKKKAGY